MKTAITGLLAAVALAALPTGANAAELVTNGGFETGTFAGWTQFGNTGFTGVQGTFDKVAPHGGTQQAFFGPTGAPGGITQILNTVAGQTYNISVWAANLGGTPNFGSISFGGTVLGALTDSAAFPYTQYTFSSVATGARTALTFSFRHDPRYWLLDDVSVTGPAGVAAVPEPATWGMMILGFGVVGAAMRRRRKVSAKVSFA